MTEQEIFPKCKCGRTTYKELDNTTFIEWGAKRLAPVFICSWCLLPKESCECPTREQVNEEVCLMLEGILEF